MLRRALILLAPLALAVLSASSAADAGARSVSEIEALIARAAEGETIELPAGVYEGNLVIVKPVVLDGRDEAVIDGLGNGTVVDVRSEGVTHRRLHVRGSGKTVTGEPAGIRVQAGGATIEHNTVEDALFGIDLRQAPDAVIRHNVIVSKELDKGRRGDGIRLWWSHGCVVEDNSVTGSRDMVFWYSENLRIQRNTVTDSRYGLHFMYSHDTRLLDNNLVGNSVGVYLMYSNRITLEGNTMRNNRGPSGYGIGLKDCDDIAINRNALLANRVGVYIDNSPSSIDSTGLFDSNLIAFNEIGLLATPNTHDNVFTGNGFIENEQPAATHGRGQLDANRFARGETGNYWSGYSGFDLDDDGVGDTPYEPRSLFNSMLASEPNLRLFIYSPSQQAVDFAARALPELSPEPTFVDPYPLTRLPATGAGVSTARRSGAGMGALSAVLVLGASGIIVAVRKEPRLSRTEPGETL